MGLPVSLRHAILGLLTIEPMTGYDLKTDWFDGSIAHFWPADQSQIYRTLESLAEAALVRVRERPGEAGPPRKVYSITASGKKELDAWLATPMGPPAVRDATMIQLFFSERAPDDITRQHLESWRDAYAARLAVYENIPLPKLGKDPKTLRQRMTLELGIAHAAMARDWAERMLKHL